MGEDATALGFLRRSGAGSASVLEPEESENDGVLESEGEEQEEVDESAFGKLMASVVEQSMYVYQWFFTCPAPELTICHAGKQTLEAVQFEIPASSTVSLSSATGVEQNGLQGKIVGTTLKY